MNKQKFRNVFMPSCDKTCFSNFIFYSSSFLVSANLPSRMFAEANRLSLDKMSQGFFKRNWSLVQWLGNIYGHLQSYDCSSLVKSMLPLPPKESGLTEHIVIVLLINLKIRFNLDQTKCLPRYFNFVADCDYPSISVHNSSRTDPSFLLL